MENKPFVSIIMPVRNECRYIERSLKACQNQTYPADKMEIIVVDGMSIDGTREIVQELIRQDSRIKLLDNPQKIAPNALNIGIKNSSGDIVLRMDGHAFPREDYVEKAVENLSGDVWAVGGPVNTVGENIMAEAIAAAMSSPFGVGNSVFRTVKDRKQFVDTVPFPAYPKWVFEKIGYFDEELKRNQDDEFNLRVIEAGGRILLTPEMTTTYYSRGNLYSLFKQYFGYGLYKIRVIQKHPTIFRFRHFIPVIFVMSAIISPICSLFNYGWLVPCMVYGSYIAGNIASSTAILIGKRFKYFYLLPLVFPCLHFGYGLGFLKGLWYFHKRWIKR
jgi:succinoglycan biosynthesis protein ExoA